MKTTHIKTKGLNNSTNKLKDNCNTKKSCQNKTNASLGFFESMAFTK